MSSAVEECNPTGVGLGAKIAPEGGGHRARRHVTSLVRVAPEPRVVPAVIRPAGTPLRPAGCRRGSTRLRQGFGGVAPSLPARCCGRPAAPPPCVSTPVGCGRVRMARRSRVSACSPRRVGAMALPASTGTCANAAATLRQLWGWLHCTAPTAAVVRRSWNTRASEPSGLRPARRVAPCATDRPLTRPDRPAVPLRCTAILRRLPGALLRADPARLGVVANDPLTADAKPKLTPAGIVSSSPDSLPLSASRN